MNDHDVPAHDDADVHPNDGRDVGPRVFGDAGSHGPDDDDRARDGGHDGPVVVHRNDAPGDASMDGRVPARL